MVESLQVSAQLTATVEVDLTAISRIRARAKDDFKSARGRQPVLPAVHHQGGGRGAQGLPEGQRDHRHRGGRGHLPERGAHRHRRGHREGPAGPGDQGRRRPEHRRAGQEDRRPGARGPGSNKVTPDELSGGTFTITNYGSAGTLMDTPIINQPQVAILGTGALVKRPVVINDTGPRRGHRGAGHDVPVDVLRPPSGRRCRRRPLPQHLKAGWRRATSAPSSASDRPAPDLLRTKLPTDCISRPAIQLAICRQFREQDLKE